MSNLYRFEEVSADELKEFFIAHEQGSFAQSLEMATLREKTGRAITYLAVYDDDELVLAAQMSTIEGRFRSADITAGPLADYDSTALLAFFTQEVKALCKQRGIVYLTISPNLDYSDKVLSNMTQLGWEYSGRINASAVGIRGGIRWKYLKDLAGLTLENYRDSYVKRHRRYIRNADPAVSLRQLKRDEIGTFLTIMKHTAERREFASRPDSYFYNLHDSFGDKATFMVAELAEGDTITPIAGIIFIESNGEIVSYLGGAISQYAKYRGSYLLHDEMIRRSIEKGYNRYNFYGIEGDIENPNSEGYGIYEFKSKFGTGRAVELIGEFVLPINKLQYFAARTLQKIRK